MENLETVGSGEESMLCGGVRTCNGVLQKTVAEKERYLREEKEAIEREARLLKGEVDPVKDKGVVEIAFGNEQYRCLRQPTRR